MMIYFPVFEGAGAYSKKAKRINFSMWELQGFLIVSVAEISSF